MSKIQLLSEETIDKIAAGEVIERPASIIKELVENSIDAGANAITVEIKDGGISFLRVTDNGSGIDRDDIKTAFLRHATSKISEASDLENITSLGFRGEALSSIAAISQVELLTKTKDSLLGYRYVIEGAKELELSDVGIPGGTTIIVRNIFFNTPVRRKFLKSPITEGSYVAEVCEHLALSRPDISIKFVSGGQVKFHTSGSGDLKELIYRIFGKEIASELVPIEYEGRELSINGYLGKPILNRSTRNYENYFINGRYVKSKVIANAFEEGYKQFLMQHKFPFFVVNIGINSSLVDVNVHPTKMDVRFSNNEVLYDIVSSAVSSTLKVREMIPDAVLVKEDSPKETIKAPEPFESNRIDAEGGVLIKSFVPDKIEKSDKASIDTGVAKTEHIEVSEAMKSPIGSVIGEVLGRPDVIPSHGSNIIKSAQAVIVNSGVQMNLFEDKLLSKDAMADYKIIGQCFDTYWLIEYRDKLLIMDQHAAHEKVKYEALMEKLNNKELSIQNINPPIVITLSPSELATFIDYKSHFEDIGFELEEFGGMDIKLRGIPMELYGKEAKELFLDILDELSEGRIKGVPEAINEKLASMACKAAVKGNNKLSLDEVWALLEALMKLDNPYNCPHGRPTIFTMSKSEMEKRFKRIV